jgi:hypothetical protein
MVARPSSQPTRVASWTASQAAPRSVASAVIAHPTR